MAVPVVVGAAKTATTAAKAAGSAVKASKGAKMAASAAGKVKSSSAFNKGVKIASANPKINAGMKAASALKNGGANQIINTARQIKNGGRDAAINVAKSGINTIKSRPIRANAKSAYEAYQTASLAKNVIPNKEETEEEIEEKVQTKEKRKKLFLLGGTGCIGCGCLSSIVIPVLLFLVVVLVPYVTVSWFTEYFDVERTKNSTLASCTGCTNEELRSIKERQWNEKISALESKYGSKIDKAALIATATYTSNLSDIIDAEYEEDYDKDNFLGAISSDFFSNLWNSFNGDAGNDFGQYSSENISLLQYIAEGMAKSGDSYSDENFKNWLINGSDNAFTQNVVYCTGATTVNEIKNFFGNVANNMGVKTETFKKEIEKGNIPFSYFTPKAAADVAISSTVGSISYYWNDGFNYLRICQYGYIEGMISGVTNIEDEEKKQKKKETVADEIIDLAEYYRYADEVEKGSDCTYVGETGDYASWKQYDPEWANVSIGSKTIKAIGCTSTASAIQIARSGTKITNLPSGYSSFNPGAFVTAISKSGGYSGNLMNWSHWDVIAPYFNSGTAHSVSYNSSTEAGLAKNLNDVLNEAEDGKYQRYIILQIHYSGGREHWVAVEGIDGNQVIINDPAKDGKTLNENYGSGNWSVDTYRVMWATDVMFGSSGSTGTGGGNVKLDYASARYKDRLEQLSKYLQCGDDLKGVKLGNSNVCKSGCMVASLAAIQYMFTGQHVDVESLISDMIEEGEWSNAAAGMGTPYFDSPSDSPIITEKWGLSGETLKDSDKNKIKERIILELKAGKKILINLGGAATTYSTVGGHFLMLDHYNENTKEIYIFNPARRGTGYITEDELLTEVLAHNKYGPWAISSNKVNDENACQTAQGSLEGLIKFLGTIEGVQGSCTVRGKEGYKTYKDSADQNYAGKTTSFGITQVYNKDLAQSLGYTNFDSDMSAGCAEKAYIDEMAMKTMELRIESVKTKYEEKSGGKVLQEYQYHALASIAHQWPVGSDYVIRQIVNTKPKSYSTYNVFLSNTGLKKSNAYQGGLNRREAEYHLFYNGNYNLEKVGDAQNTESYYNKRVEVYESE